MKWLVNSCLSSLAAKTAWSVLPLEERVGKACSSKVHFFKARCITWKDQYQGLRELIPSPTVRPVHIVATIVNDQLESALCLHDLPKWTITGGSHDIYIVITSFSRYVKLVSAESPAKKIAWSIDTNYIFLSSLLSHYRLSAAIDNRLSYQRKYDRTIFGCNRLDQFVLPPLQI